MGMDSSYHVLQTNVSVRRGIIWGISVHNIHKKEGFFSLVCAFKKAIKNFKVKVDVQRWVPRFQQIFKIDVLVSSNLRLHLFLSYGNSPQ